MPQPHVMTNLTGSTKSQSQSQSQLSYQNHHHHHHGGYPFTNLDPNSSYSTSTKLLDSAPTSSNFPSVLSSFNTRTPTPTNAYPPVAPIYSVAEDSRPDFLAADSPNPFQTTHQKLTNFSNPTSFASRTRSPASAFHYNRGRTDHYSSTPRGATTAPSAADIGAGPGPTTFHNHTTPNPSTFAARATSGSRDLGRGFDRDQILIGDSSDYRPPDETQSQRYPPLPPPHLAVTDNTEEGITGNNNNNPGQVPSSLSFAPSGAAPVLLPRTSSLLPPPRNVGYAGLLKKEPIPPEPATTKPRRSHSRASSIGVITDSFRNLNRWSASTSSSRASNRPGATTVASVPERAGQDQRDRERGAVKEQPSPQQQQSAANSGRSTFSRRMSVDSVAIIANATETITSRTFTNQSPRKLSKWRPSDGGILTTSSRSRANSNASSRLRPQENSPPLSSAPAPNLPPIVTLPSLEFPDAASPEPATARPTDPPAPATNLLSRIGTDTSSPSSPYSSQGNNSRAGQQDYLGDEPTDPNNNRGNTPALLPAAQLIPNNTMPTESRGHTRSRSSNTKSSIDSTAPRDRDRGKQPSQKAMLSKALAKANTAVQLDNAQDYQSARQSYGEACDLLQHVLARTTGEEDKKKLEAIRRTYTSRIDELDNMVPAQAFTYNSKALPPRPESLEYNGVEVRPSYDDDFDEPFYGTATTTRYGRTPTPDSRNLATPVPKEQSAPNLQSSFNKSPVRRNFEGSLSIPRAQGNYMPAPLSPRRPVSPARPASPPEPIVRQDFSMPADRLAPAIDMSKGHTRNLSHESTSWLDPIDESGGSAASSVHSRTSSRGYRRKHIRAVSGDTEAEFDAALDAAVEAAYDEGYEVMDSSDIMYDDHNDEDDEDDRVVANAMRRVEWAKEQVRQTEREAAIEAARERDMQRRLQEESRISTYDEGGFYNGDSSDEEEERVLEDMTRNFAMQSFTFDQPSRQQSGSGRDRESDSSGVTQRTWHSSMGSNPPPTASTVLSTVTEMPPMSAKASAPPPSLPPGQALPQIPSPNVRSRRLSGQNHKQLKIETVKVNPPPPIGPASAFQAKPGSYVAQQRQAMSATSTRPGPFSNRVPSSPSRSANPPILAPPTPPSPRQTRVSSEEYDEFEEMRTDSPSSARPALRKNQSSSSLRSQKNRQLSVATTDIPDTPLNSTMSGSLSSRQPAMPTLPTPIVTAFSQKITGGFGGLYLFDSDFHSPLPPGSPSSVNQLGPEVPLPLEPCPADAMLRPFWLMRALYQTLCHPRGGYITNKLFIPRDVWKVKGVKLRALDDKSSQCDLLTAALLNLARVDSNDADAVLEEMQTFENVLEQVQVALTKKLGNEVGLQGMARENENGDAMPAVPRSASVSGKGAFSWRRLRSKGSAANMSSAYGSRGNSGGGAPSIPEKEVLGNGSGTLPSLPMVANPSSRPAKRDVHNVQFDGPYALYMLSLARLFDAAQTVDLIARQVDDPGLRHADKTQVGLELCTRHAAEFFGFYICRFVLSDLGLLLDKFVKRGSEWVLV